MWLVMIVSGFVADLLRRKHILTTTNVRKLCNTIGNSRPPVNAKFHHAIQLADELVFDLLAAC